MNSDLPEPTSLYQKILNYKYIIIIIICVLIVGYFYYKNKTVKSRLTTPATTSDFSVIDVNNNLITVKGTLVSSKSKLVKKQPEIIKEESDIEDEDEEIVKHNLTPSEMKTIASKLSNK